MRKISIIAISLLTFFCSVNVYASCDSEQNKSSANSTSSQPKTAAVKEVTSVEQLQIYPLFEKYKRHQDCVLTIMEFPGAKFRELEVKNNTKLVNEVRALVEKDSARASHVTQTFQKDTDEIAIWFDFNAMIGYTITLDNASCTLFLKEF